MEQVILVDERDTNVGVMEKLEAHQKGRLHRAFSIVLFNSEGNILLQKRAEGKYHSAGLWTNTCCSHPRPEEPLQDATARRLREEMGIETPLQFRYKFIYKAELGDLIEHEYDHVFTGVFDGRPEINPQEASDWKYASPSEVLADIEKHPSHYSAWFQLIMRDLSF